MPDNKHVFVSNLSSEENDRVFIHPSRDGWLIYSDEVVNTGKVNLYKANDLSISRIPMSYLESLWMIQQYDQTVENFEYYVSSSFIWRWMKPNPPFVEPMIWWPDKQFPIDSFTEKPSCEIPEDDDIALYIYLEGHKFILDRIIRVVGDSDTVISISKFKLSRTMYLNPYDDIVLLYSIDTIPQEQKYILMTIKDLCFANYRIEKERRPLDEDHTEGSDVS